MAELQPKTAPVAPDKRGSEYLANERTFLAWIRTSVAMMSLGFVVDRFGLFLRELGSRTGAAHVRLSPAVSSFLVGDLLMGFGGALALLSAWRYHVVDRSIDRGEAKADRGLVALVSVLVAFLAGAMILIARP
ncbi:MAG: DUF202 domain-containing protein [Acidobacteriota bacterium]|nr:DUF202 domain-containing protein [Acidobacteriota bacterium]